MAVVTASRRQRSFPRSEPLTPSVLGAVDLHLQHYTCHLHNVNLQNVNILCLTWSITRSDLHRSSLSSAACFGVQPCYHLLAQGPVYHRVSTQVALPLGFPYTDNADPSEDVRLRPCTYNLRLRVSLSVQTRLSLSNCNPAAPEPVFQSLFIQHTCTPLCRIMSVIP